MFVYDIAIDLRTLFCVSTNQHEPEISKEMIEQLKEKGWVESENVFGKCLVLPKEKRDRIIPALAKALINWRITSNQARTFSLMETLAVAISDNANTLRQLSEQSSLMTEKNLRPSRLLMRMQVRMFMSLCLVPAMS